MTADQLRAQVADLTTAALTAWSNATAGTIEEARADGRLVAFKEVLALLEAEPPTEDARRSDLLHDAIAFANGDGQPVSDEILAEVRSILDAAKGEGK